ncbi:hypothetical protein [Pseudomonas alabamensis]|uniref:hypothetical protein n=1 Tax=Pseudomonas alabamensis TaxID=3064349 RepID=UPI0011A6B3BB
MRNMLSKALCALLLIPAMSFAQDLSSPKPYTIDPLALYARTVYPEDVTTVGEAIRYLLEPTGYQLVTAYPAPSDAISLVDQRIPPIAKVHRTMPVIDAVQLLIGLDNWVVIDRNHKLISVSEKKS